MAINGKQPKICLKLDFGGLCGYAVKMFSILNEFIALMDISKKFMQISRGHCVRKNSLLFQPKKFNIALKA